ncbi:MAG: tetratricopeptide repeat protein [Sphingobium sp.]
MILISLLLMQAAYSPETEAVMNRSRREAQERRADESRARSAATAAGKERQAAQTGMALSAEAAAKFQACLDTASEDADAGVRFAQAWALDGGSFAASQCRGFAEAQAERWEAAAGAFEAAANEAQRAGSSVDSARLFAQAGNAALAAGHAEMARGYFDAALGHGLPDGLAKGEIHLDRARALVALGDGKGARTDIDMALKQAPEDPLGWLLSATLARRQKDLARAKADIAEAKRRSPDDASVALEEGNIAILSDDETAAKAAWQRVLTIAPEGDPARAARASLAQLAEGDDGAAGSAAPAPAPSETPAP